MKKIFNKKGVSMIVLVITIIVMIILATVIILSLDGNNIIGRANEAKNKNNVAAEKEKILLALNNAKFKTYDNVTEESLQKALNSQFGKNKAEFRIFDDGTLSILLKESGNSYYFDKDISFINTRGANDSTPGFLAGEGTEASPYLVESIEDMIYFSDQVNSGNTYTGKYVSLKSDMDFKAIGSYANHDTIVDEENGTDLMTSMLEDTGFTPIGSTSTLCFKGNFNGNGYQIRNLYINSDQTFVGFFGYVTDGTIQNVEIRNATIKGGSNIGTLAGRIIRTTTTACNFEGEFDVETTDVANTAEMVGLLIGAAYTSNIYECYTKSDVYMDGAKVTFGGIVGYFESAVGTGSTRMKIKQCYSISNINLEAATAGGIIGHSTSLVDIEECYHIGDIIEKNAANQVSGIIGYTTWPEYVIIKNCYHIGDLNSRTSGGIAWGADTFNCYTVGKITSTYSGGKILGMNYGAHLVHCFGWSESDPGALTEAKITSQLSSYNNKEYGLKGNAVIGYKCDVMTDDEFKSPEFVNELNTLITASIVSGEIGTITETQQDVWKQDTNNINNGYPIFVWQEE